VNNIDYISNLGSLKIDLMLCGIRGEVSGDSNGEVVPIQGRFGRAGEGIDIILPGPVLVNVPSGEEFTKNSPYLLKSIDGGFAITNGKTDVEVSLLEPPEFYSRNTTTGIPFSSIAKVHGSYTVITPNRRCDFFNSSIECRYCAGNFDVEKKPGEADSFTVDEVLETVEAVLKERASEIVYLSIGFTEGDDGGITTLAPYIQAVKKHFNCLVAVEALPPKTNKWIDETYALGADSVLYNLEIFDKELFKVICPGRAELIGRERYIEALKHAATIFPNGTVASHLIVGLEPPGATCQGIDFLTEMGVVPILPVYRPQAGKALRIEPLTTEIILPIYKRLYKAVTENDINMHWVRDISSVTTPIESRLLSGEKGGLKSSILENFYKSRLGLRTAWGLSTIRRILRVRSNDPRDSS
jgi:biotin synthase-related radical SAM superfamily protein